MTRGTRRIATPVAVLIAACALGACASAPSERPALGTASASPYTDDVFRLSGEADRAYRESRWLEAARKYRQLTEAVPLDAYAWFRLGNTYAQQGDFDRAIVAYESSLERDATQARPWFNLSTAYLLKAQTAMMKAWAQLREGDPARAMIEARLDALRPIVHERIEDGTTRTSIR